MKKYILCFFLFCFQHNTHAQTTDSFCRIYNLLATQEHLINFLPPNFNDYAKECTNNEKTLHSSPKLCLSYALTAQEMYRDYFMPRQLDFSTDTENKNIETEVRLRNVCMSNFMDIYFNCIYYKCLEKYNQHSDWFPVFINRNLTGEQICGFINNINCLEKDLASLKKFLQQAGGYMADLFLYDMDSVIMEIKSQKVQAGKPTSLLKVETEHPICFSAYKNGDTVWHVLATIKATNGMYSDDFLGWFNSCLSFLDNEEKEFLYIDAFFKTNNKNKTAIEIAYEHKNSKMFELFGRYFSKQNISCASLTNALAKETQIDKTYLFKLCPQ